MNASNPRPLSARARAWWAWAIGAVAAGVGVMVLAHLPGVPYNARELVEDMAGSGLVGPVFRLSLLVGGVIGLGALAGWSARWVFAQDDRVRWLAPGLLAGALAAGTAVALIAPAESVGDLVGFPVWDIGWRLESSLRMAALLLLPLASLALGAVWWDRLLGWGPRIAVRNVFHVAVPVLLCLVIGVLIVVRFAATDNLTELIGAGLLAKTALLSVLLVLALNAAALGRAAASRGLDRVALMIGVTLTTLVAALLAYLLFRAGTAGGIRKYDWTYTFSAAQFLLGADRQATLSPAQMLLRWYALYLGLNVIFGLGVGVGLRLAPLPRIREDADDLRRAGVVVMPEETLAVLAGMGETASAAAEPAITNPVLVVSAPPLNLPSRSRAQVAHHHSTPLAVAPRRRIDPFILISLLFTALVVYSSIVPLHFEGTWSQGWATFTAAMRGNAPAAPNQLDWSTNAVLFGVLGFLWMTALVDPRHGRIAAALFAPAVWVAALALGFAMELAQAFIAERTVSRFDVLAQAMGLTVGVGLWIAARPRLADPFRSAVLQRPLSPARALLLIYAIGYLMYAVMPLHFISGVDELQRKWATGQINLVPFTYAWEGMDIAAWGLATDLLLAIPIGAWLAGRRRPWLDALLIFAGIEVVQLVLRSRVTDTTDVLVGLAGAGIGMQLATRSWHAWSSGPAWWYHAAALAYAILLLLLHLAPFRFDGFDLTAVRNELSVAPFTRLYEGSPFIALDQMLRRILLGIPLGALLGLARPRGSAALTVAITACGVWFLLIEVLQAASTAHVGDFTDVLLGVGGGIAGLALVRRLVHR